ncbi:unnamed protein product [Durusdinium trenchii]|uniref:ATP-grasp domain-containing protein n=1 Tax=Durusdinium trenchii TaxID=1381693 RepID=A0ABP0PGJ0_9DINO
MLTDELRYPLRHYSTSSSSSLSPRSLPKEFSEVWDDFADPESSDSPPELVARFLIRHVLRSMHGCRLRRVFLLVCGYPPKGSAVEAAFASYGHHTVCLYPHFAAEGADVIAELLDSRGFVPQGVIPFADCGIHLADEMNSRLGVRHNSPKTSSLRRDKYLQQAVLQRAGLPAALQIVTADVRAAQQFARANGQVVVKPRASSGGDGVWLCNDDDDILTAFQQELGKRHQELQTNTELIVAQALIGEEWVVNTVSRDGVHKVSDAWYGPPKLIAGAGPQHFLYNVQYLAGESPRFLEVTQMVKSSLTALGLQEGAAHTELVWLDKPYIYEVNARCSGGLPRVPPPTQLDVLAMSLFDQSGFSKLPEVPSNDMTNRVAVVFLIGRITGWLTAAALEKLSSLKTFWRFERGLAGCGPPFKMVPVTKTTGLFSSPGAVVLQGESEDVLQDAQTIRKVETTAYVETTEESRKCPATTESSPG